MAASHRPDTVRPRARRALNAEKRLASIAANRPVFRLFLSIRSNVPACSLRKRLQLNDDGEELTPPESGGEEPEPEDVNPAREDEDEEQGAEEAPLDSEDEGEDDDVLVTLAQAMPSGYTVGPPPPSEVLEYKGAQAGELVERIILFNWAGVGWSEGHVVHENTDGRDACLG